MNRRSEKLDKYLNRRVQITFHDGDVKTGILEFGRLDFITGDRSMYSITLNGTGTMLLFFRKSNVKSIKEVRE